LSDIRMILTFMNHHFSDFSWYTPFHSACLPNLWAVCWSYESVLPMRSTWSSWCPVYLWDSPTSLTSLLLITHLAIQYQLHYPLTQIQVVRRGIMAEPKTKFRLRRTKGYIFCVLAQKISRTSALIYISTELNSKGRE